MTTEQTRTWQRLDGSPRLRRPSTRKTYKSDMETNHVGEFVAIDVLGKKCYLADSPEVALQEAREKAPHGVFHLIRVGSPGVFSSSYGWGHESSVSWAL